MEGFLSGFKLSPKPLQGVTQAAVKRKVVAGVALKEALVALTSAEGLSSWLGETEKFISHVGIKFETTVDGEKSKSVITTLDLPKRIVFMVEALGEFDFAISEKTKAVQVELTVRRAVTPDQQNSWKDSVEQILARLEKVLSHG